MIFECRVPASLAALPGRVHVMYDEPESDNVRQCSCCHQVLDIECFSSWIHGGKRTWRTQCKSCTAMKLRAKHVPKARVPAIPEDVRDAIIADRRKGLCLREISNKYRVSKTAIHRLAERYGV